ncbi:MAG: YbaN family protein [Planctomycetota bacterium]
MTALPATTLPTSTLPTAAAPDATTQPLEGWAERLLAGKRVCSVLLRPQQREFVLRWRDRRVERLSFDEAERRAEAAEPVEAVSWTEHRDGGVCYVAAPPHAIGVRKAVYLAGAAGAFLLAALGVLLPGLPTTPFLLLTSWLLIRSSRRLHHRLLTSRTFGPLLRDWQSQRGIRPAARRKAVLLLVLVVSSTLAFGPAAVWLKAVFCFVAAVGLWVILRIPAVERLSGGDSDAGQ